MNILDLYIENVTYNDILSRIQNHLSQREYFSFSYVNVNVSLNSNSDKTLRGNLNNISAIYPDGIGVYLASKFLYGKLGLKERVNGTDLYYKILDLAQKGNYKIFFFGGSDKAASVLNQNLKMIYPNLIIGGIIPKDESFDEQILEKINQTNSDILFLGLGTPYQEKWIATFGKKTNIPIQIAVGSGIDFLSGTYKRAPQFIRNVGLEWLYRLFLEPKRLWKRYLLGIPHFLFLIVKQKLFSRETF